MRLESPTFVKRLKSSHVESLVGLIHDRNEFAVINSLIFLNFLSKDKLEPYVPEFLKVLENSTSKAIVNKVSEILYKLSPLSSDGVNKIISCLTETEEKDLQCAHGLYDVLTHRNHLPFFLSWFCSHDLPI